MAPHNPASSPPVTTNGGAIVSQSDPHAAESKEAIYSAIKTECERALTAFRSENHTEALTLIKEVSHRHENNAFVHHFQAAILSKVANIADDETAKQRNLKSAVDSARRACSLSPNSIEFALLHADLLLQDLQYEETVKECERALAIENPVDPAEESFQEEQKIPTAEGRIASVQRKLKSLIQNANIASISAWMDKFVTGEESAKFRLVSIRSPQDSQIQNTGPDFESDDAADGYVNELLADLDSFPKESSTGISVGDSLSSD